MVEREYKNVKLVSEQVAKMRYQPARCDKTYDLVIVRKNLSNWAYMVIAALAWNLKAWFALTMPEPEKSGVVLKMEFRRFLNTFVRLPRPSKWRE